MEEFEQVPPEYQKGFNNGYAIGKHMPDLAAKLETLKGKSLQMEGLKAGFEQVNKEMGKDKTKDNLPKWLRKDRISSLSKGNDRTKNKEDRDRE